MVATCSDEARTALGLVGPETVPGVSPIHVLEASWPMQSCPVEVLLAKQRELTLLEKYTLRAFNEIPGVTAAEIANRLGLKEPELIDEALLALKNAQALEESSTTTTDDDELSEDREQLSRLQQLMEANTFRGVVLKNKQREIEILEQRIYKAQSDKSWLGKISSSIHGVVSSLVPQVVSKAVQRLLNFTAKVTTKGKEYLSTGIISEPAKREVYDLTRSLANGVVLLTKGHGFSRSDLTDDARYWIPLKDTKKHLGNPSDGDIITALQNGGQLEGRPEFLENKAQLPIDSIHYLQICITLGISHEDDSCQFIVHNHRRGNRLKWIEEVINSDAQLEESLLSRFAELLPSISNASESNRVQASKAQPLVHIKRLIGEAGWSGSQGMVVLNDPKKLFKFVDCEDTLVELIENRTSVELKNIQKWKLDSSGDSLRFSLPSSHANLPLGSISTLGGTIYPSSVEVAPKVGKNSILVPVLVIDEELGKSSVIHIEKTLKEEIDAKSCFLMTRSEPDFTRWLDEGLKQLSGIDDVRDLLSSARELATSVGSGIDVQRMLFEGLFSKRQDLFEDMIADCNHLVEILSEDDGLEQGGWPFVEPYVQQALFDSCLIETATDSLSNAWRLHQTGDKQLPWEDAARLEAAYYGHCNLTRFDANRNFEEIILDLANENEITTETVFAAISGLEHDGIIDRDLKNEASNVRIERNNFSHETEVQADLQYTLRVISVMRKLDAISLKRTSGMWGAPVIEDWDRTMSEVEMMDYLSSVTKVVQDAQKAGRTCLGTVWTGAIREGMPTNFDTLPMDLITALNAAPIFDHPPQFSDFTGQVVDNSLDGWLESLRKPDRLEITPEVQGVVDTFNSMGMEELGPKIISRFLAGVEQPTSIDDLIEELDNSESLSKAIPISDLRNRWKRAIKERSFTCDMESLAAISENSLDGLGAKLSEELLKRALHNQFPIIQAGDVQAVKNICNSIESIQGVSEIWNSTCLRVDGFLSDQVTRKIRSGDDLILAGSTIEKLMPILNPENFPKTNASFENIISAGVKEKKAKEDNS